MKEYQGVITAIITPFDEQGNLDEEALRKLVDFQIENGVAGIVPCGTTGESPTLSHEEHNKVVKIVCDQAKGRVKVIAGSGSNSTKEAIDLTKHAKESGADASLQIAPYYNKPSQEGFYQHFKAISDAVEIPLIVYNIPGRTAKNIETTTMVRIAQLKNVIGIKEASGNICQMMDVIDQTPDDFLVLSGDDNMTLPLIAVGGHGVISVASNLIPDKMVKMVSAALDGKLDEAKKLHYQLMPFFKAEFCDTNPIPIKTMLAMKGMCKESFRLPMCETSTENKQKIKKVLNNL
ncbi:4-hydroxy-tetrahydrodipicolinate synthase [Nanoarchaeota archaeon]